ncbi:hypothetical protein [Rhizobium sp.]|jgi:hypothetical protein
MSKFEIDASRNNLRISAEGAVAMVIAIALIVAAVAGCIYLLA